MARKEMMLGSGELPCTDDVVCLTELGEAGEPFRPLIPPAAIPSGAELVIRHLGSGHCVFVIRDKPTE